LVRLPANRSSPKGSSSGTVRSSRTSGARTAPVAGASVTPSIPCPVATYRCPKPLRSTIMVWCESGYSLVEASKALYIHRNTLIYRLNKIEVLLGRSPRDYEHAFALYLACLFDSMDAR
jgi:hypothetical protein